MQIQNLSFSDQDKAISTVLGSITVVHDHDNKGFEQLDRHRRVILLENPCLSSLLFENLKMGPAKCMTFQVKLGSKLNYRIMKKISEYLNKVGVVHKVLYFPDKGWLQIYCFNLDI